MEFAKVYTFIDVILKKQDIISMVDDMIPAVGLGK
jgi:hypothetical protein